jgi:hypothetical protein
MHSFVIRREEGVEKPVGKKSPKHQSFFYKITYGHHPKEANALRALSVSSR